MLGPAMACAQQSGEMEFTRIGPATRSLPGDPLLWSADMTAHWLSKRGFAKQGGRAAKAALSGAQMLERIGNGTLGAVLGRGSKRRRGDLGRIEAAVAAGAGKGCESPQLRRLLSRSVSTRFG